MECDSVDKPVYHKKAREGIRNWLDSFRSIGPVSLAPVLMATGSVSGDLFGICSAFGIWR